MPGISPLPATDLSRYYDNTFVMYKNELVNVRVTGEAVYITPVKTKKKTAVTHKDFCNNVEVVWPVAGYRQVNDWIMLLKYVRDDFKKAPTLRGVDVTCIKSSNTDVDVIQCLFFPVYTKDVPCSLAAIAGNLVYIGSACKTYKCGMMNDTLRVFVGNDSLAKCQVNLINQEVGKMFMEAV